MRVVLPVDGVIRSLALVTAILALLGLAVTLLASLVVLDPWLAEVQESLVRLFSLDGEANLPTWFSSALLLLCAGLATLNGRLAKARGDRARWLLIGALFLALSADEAAIIHEMSIKPIRAAFDPGGLLYYGWVIPGAVLVVVTAAYFSRFIVALPAATRNRLIGGAGIFVLGALVVESFSAYLDDHHGRGLPYGFTTVVEETLEMTGLVVIIAGLLANLRSGAGVFEVELVRRNDRSPAGPDRSATGEDRPCRPA